MVKSSTLLLNLNNFNIFGCEHIYMYKAYETAVAVYCYRPEKLKITVQF